MLLAALYISQFLSVRKQALTGTSTLYLEFTRIPSLSISHRTCSLHRKHNFVLIESVAFFMVFEQIKIVFLLLDWSELTIIQERRVWFIGDPRNDKLFLFYFKYCSCIRTCSIQRDNGLFRWCWDSWGIAILTLQDSSQHEQLVNCLLTCLSPSHGKIINLGKLWVVRTSLNRSSVIDRNMRPVVETLGQSGVGCVSPNRIRDEEKSCSRAADKVSDFIRGQDTVLDEVVG